MRAAYRPMRLLCARELQVSIKDSVHRLLSDQIDALGMQGFFSCGESFIRGINGSEFLFKGLRHNAVEIKSMERIGICWVEEAQAVSEESWKLLIPTVRDAKSEIWVTFNPEQKTDPTYQRFITSTPPRSIVRRINWRDNPWLTSELDAERLWMLKTDPDNYAWIWEGECRTVTNAQVLKGKVRVESFTPRLGADWDGPYFGVDWGYAQDPTALVKLWVRNHTLYIESEAWGVGVEIDHLPAFFDSVQGTRQYVIRADSARPETISYMQRSGFRVVGAKKGPGSVEDGVAHLRGYESIVIHPSCTHALDEARLWSFKTDRLSGDVQPTLAQGYDHIWDAARYALEPIIRRRLDTVKTLSVSKL